MTITNGSSNGMNGLARPDKWFNHPFSMLQTNLREIDVTMDVSAVADFIKEYGANAWLISVGGIQAHYPTKLPFQAINPFIGERPGGDLIADAVQAAKSHGLKLLARMDFSKVVPEVASEHPDWCYRNSKGELQEHTAGLVSVCPCGEWYQARLFDILEEVTSNYALDGFFFNWISFNEFDYYKVVHGPCHCENCKAAFAKFAPGVAIPATSDEAAYPQWYQWSSSVLDTLGARVRAFIAERAPNTGLIMGQTADMMFHEANNEVGRELWHHATSEWAGIWRSFVPEVPVLVNSTTFFDMPYRMANEEPHLFAQYLIQCISRGGNPSTYMMGVPGKIPYSIFDVGSEITRFHGKWKAVYDGLRPIAKTGLVRPDRSHITAARYDQATAEYRGLYTALKEKHIPFDILSQERLEGIHDNGGLERYEVIILPDLDKLPAEAASALDAWVKVGGKLIATGATGHEEDGSVQLHALPATRLTDSVTKRELMWSSYISPERKLNDVHAYEGPVIPLWGGYHYCDWKQGSKSIYKRLDHAPFAPPEKAYGNLQVDHPGAAVCAYGSGKGIFIPFNVGRGYHEIGLRTLRDFFLLVLEKEGQVVDPLSVQIAEQVEITVHQNGPQTVLHLINMSGAKRSNVGEIIPIVGGTIHVRGQGVTAHALRADKHLEVKDGVIRLDTLELFDVVVLEGLDRV